MVRYLILLTVMAGCSSSKEADKDNPPGEALSVKAESSWYGLPLTPGLPLKLSKLDFSMNAAAINVDYPELLTPEGMKLDPKSTATAKLSSDGSLRYLLVKLQVSESDLKSKWLNAEERTIDLRHKAAVWYLPDTKIQIQLRSVGKALELLYLRVTPLEMVVGIPNDAGNTLASLIGKPLNLSKRFFNRVQPSKDGAPVLAWAAPLIDETVSLKAQLRLSNPGNNLSQVSVFLTDDPEGTLRSRLEEKVKAMWKVTDEPHQYRKGDVQVRFGRIQKLGFRKRDSYPFTLHFSQRISQGDKTSEKVAPSSESNPTAEPAANPE